MNNPSDLKLPPFETDKSKGWKWNWIFASVTVVLNSVTVTFARKEHTSLPLDFVILILPFLNGMLILTGLIATFALKHKGSQLSVGKQVSLSIAIPFATFVVSEIAVLSMDLPVR